MAALAHRLEHGDSIALTLGDFLNDDRVGAGRHDTAGKNPRCFAGPDLGCERPTGRDFTDYAQVDWGGHDVRRARRIAIHCRQVGRRLGPQRLEIGGEHAAERIIERDSFRRERRGVRQHVIERFGNGDERHCITPANDNDRSGHHFFR